LTDFDEIWHDGAYCHLTADRPLKFELLKIQDVGGRHLENQKNGDVSAAV